MHVFPHSGNHFRAIHTVGSANRFCNVDHTISTSYYPKAGVSQAGGKPCLTGCKSTTCQTKKKQ